MFGMGIGVTFRINHRKRPQPAYSPGQGILKFGRAAFRLVLKQGALRGAYAHRSCALEQEY